MIKKSAYLVAVIVLAMIASLSVAGCTSSVSNQSGGQASPSVTSQHNATLERFANALRQDAYGNPSNTVRTWDVTWNNDTNVTVLFDILASGTGNASANGTSSGTNTMLIFPTTQDATNFLDAFNKTDYHAGYADYKSSSTSSDYYNATGHYPSVYKDYTYINGSISSGSAKAYVIEQFDNIVLLGKSNMTF